MSQIVLVDYAMGAAAAESLENPSAPGFQELQDDVVNKSRLLIIRCFMEIASHQELPAQMVAIF